MVDFKKLFEDYEEITEEEYLGFWNKNMNDTATFNYGLPNKYVYFKKKSQTPFILKNKDYGVRIYKTGNIEINVPKDNVTYSAYKSFVFIPKDKIDELSNFLIEKRKELNKND